MNAWRTPKRIFNAHPADQPAQLPVDLRSSSLWARLPTPVAAKAGSVPMRIPPCAHPAVTKKMLPGLCRRALDGKAGVSAFLVVSGAASRSRGTIGGTDVERNASDARRCRMIGGRLPERTLNIPATNR
jgi:hypothetical protein